MMTKRVAQARLVEEMQSFAMRGGFATSTDIDTLQKWMGTPEFLEICDAADAGPDAVRGEFDRLFKAAIGDAFAMAL